MSVKKCNGKTQQGTQCSRAAKHGEYCYQHIEKSDTKKITTTKSGLPPYKIMIARAILADDDKKGSSRQTIKKYLYQNYKIEKDRYHYVNSTIAKLTKSGELIRNPKHMGHFKLCPELKKVND